MKFIGKRGTWTARVESNGEDIPVVHSTYMNWGAKTYREGNNSSWEGRVPGPPQRWVEHLNRIARMKMVIVQQDKSPTDPTRVGYIGLFFIDNIKIDGDVITFSIVGRG